MSYCITPLRILRRKQEDGITSEVQNRILVGELNKSSSGHDPSLSFMGDSVGPSGSVSTGYILSS
jgi:hypothetical protein